MAGILQIMHDPFFVEAYNHRIRNSFADNGRDTRRIALKLMGAVPDHMMVAVLNRHLRLKRFADGIRQGFHAVKKTVKCLL